jgi:hypothetical protein
VVCGGDLFPEDVVRGGELFPADVVGGVVWCLVASCLLSIERFMK